jgi:hypothetical protein
MNKINSGGRRGSRYHARPIILLMLLICCKNNKQANEIIIPNTEANNITNTEVILPEHELIDKKKSIFTGLFSGLSSNPYDYKDIYNIKEEPAEEDGPNSYRIVVENEWFKMSYRPDQTFNNPMDVRIYKKTDKVMLGEYIGENISVLLNEFKEVPKISDHINGQKYVDYGYSGNYEAILFVILENDIIIRIIYSHPL